MIEFPRSLTIEACEGVIRTVSESTQDDELQLPVDTSRAAFGGLAAAIQAINTWGRSSQRRRLLLRHSVSNNEIDEAIRRPHKFAAAMYAKSIAVDGEPATDVRMRLLSAAQEAVSIQASSKFGQRLGPLCWFVFVDHSTKGFDRNFYINDPNRRSTVRNPDQLNSVICSMVEKSTSVAGGGKSLEKTDLDHLGRMFNELFVNSHEHGTRSKLRADWLRPGVRLIYTNGINLTEKGAEGSLRNIPALAEYLSAESPDANDETKRRFVEISIVDSGLGYCGRWNADHGEPSFPPNSSIGDEYAIFRKCFSFRQTSSASDHKGHGLPVVMDRLTKLRGFVRIRSGRLALFRNFISDPYTPNDECQFNDWTSLRPASESQTIMPPVSGVAITILIPLEAKQ